MPQWTMDGPLVGAIVWPWSPELKGSPVSNQRSTARVACRLLAAVLVCVAVQLPVSAQGSTALTVDLKKRMAEFAERFWKTRPPTRFEAWNPVERKKLFDEALAFGPIPEGTMREVAEILWKPAAKFGPRLTDKAKTVLKTPYGDATFIMKGTAGKGKGLVIGLHGGGEGAGSAGEPAGTWIMKDCLGMYPQGIRLVHDTWNTVHGERFILTLIEIAKAQFGVDPDRVYSMGFSMGGTGSWFMAGRHPDLLAGSSPCAGVIMAAPKSQVPEKKDVLKIEHGLVPNVRNLAMWYYIGLADKNCMPGTYLYVKDLLDELRQEDKDGYRNIHFKTIPGLAHAFPPGEPAEGLKFMEKERRRTFPTKIVWEYATDPEPRPNGDPVDRLPKHVFYWIRCRELRDAQQIRVELADNVIELETAGTAEGAKGITLYLNDKLIDPRKPVVVRHRKKEIYSGRPVPDFSTIVETMDEKVETSMIFDRRIDL